jgi:hypothetical protein
VKRSNILRFTEHLKSTGFLRVPGRCSAYISCVSFLAFERECPTGYYFNPRIPACDLSSNVDCNNCPDTGVHSLANPASCTRWTLCVNGHALPQECAPGTFFDERLGACNIAEKVECAADTCGQVCTYLELIKFQKDLIDK